jgi:hypothetical protein
MLHKDFIEICITIFEYTKLFLCIFETCRCLQKEKIDLLKKKRRAGVVDARQASPDLRPARAWRGQISTTPLDLDPMARPSSSSRRHARERAPVVLARVWIGDAHRGVSGGWLVLDRWRGRLVGNAQPGEVHAEEVVRAVVSTTPR